MNFSEVSTTMKCIISLTIQYMVIFAALGICRSYLDFRQQAYDKSEVQKALKHASETVFYAPMVCLMFVGFRMRVLQLTKGEGNPQEWVQFAMQAVAYSILVNTLLVLAVPIFTQKEVELDEETHDVKLDQPDPFNNPMIAMLLTGVRYAAFLGLYAGFATVCVGLYMFEPPAGTWDGDLPPVSPAVQCTCILANTFFAVYFLAAASRTYSQFNPKDAAEGHHGNTTFEHVMLRAADTLAMAPMLCTLFLAARMRALQMDPVSGNPQSWAQACFYTCTYALVAQCMVSVAIPLALGGKVIKTKVEGDVQYEVGGNWALVKGLTVFRYLIQLSVYAAATAVVCSVFTIEHPEGKEYTPQVSPTMQCVINLSFQYFFIYLLLWIVYTLEDFWGSEFKALEVAKEAVESAKATVQLAPMLSVLFIATRMRALQITDNRGAPQGYVQDGMYLASWALLVQFLMCLFMPVLTGKVYHCDSLDPDKPKADKTTEDLGVCGFPIPFSAVAVTIVRYLALVSLLGGLTAVITGVFLMTPENANGRGSMPLVGDYVTAPASPTDISGVKSSMKSTGKTIGGGVTTVNGATDSATSVVSGF